MNFQTIILKLQKFWADQNCIMGQPYDVEKGAGTMNPSTFLRVLGPEPWRVAYVEPSRRPADGRYGDNPNRLFQHHQYQVIIKPSPDNIQELYLQSLAELGIRQEEHDIRFVEDNWESPTLGAWGLGWEVWLDGMEISQFTYFQQVGSIDVKPVTVEITYGLERLAMYIQGVENVFDIEWVDGVTYGDVFHTNEVEQSFYNFQVADTALLFDLFDKYEAEAKRVIEAGYIRPAYDYVLKHAGATIPCRDIVDERVIEEVKTGIPYYEKKLPKDAYGDRWGLAPKSQDPEGFFKYRRLPKDSYKQGIITDIRQVGGYPEYKGTPYVDTDGDGMPDEWEVANGLNPNDPNDANEDCTGDGYTNIEKYINGISTKNKVDWTDLKNNYDTLAGKGKLM